MSESKIDLERLASEAGFRTGNFHHGGEPFVQAVSSTTFRVELHKFAALVLEEAAKVCDVTPPEPFRPSIEAAHSIRAIAASLRPTHTTQGQSNAK